MFNLFSFLPKFSCKTFDKRDKLRLSGKCSPNGKVTERLFVPDVFASVLLWFILFLDADSCNIDDLLEIGGKKFCAFPMSGSKVCYIILDIITLR